MRRYVIMTIGFLCIFLGIKFHLVDSYTLTSRATKFYNQRLGSGPNLNQTGAFSNNGGYGNFNGSPSSGFYNPQYNSQFNSQYGSQYGSPYNAQGSYGQSDFNSWGSFPTGTNDSNGGSPFQNAGFQSGLNSNTFGTSSTSSLGGLNLEQKTITTPPWLGWPAMFLGIVMVIFGLIQRR